MRIAQIAPIIERVPPRKYGGTERVVYELVEELVKRGHDVTLFASGDSLTSARLVSFYEKSLREVGAADLYGINVSTLLHIGKAYQMQDQFDLIHDHNGLLSLPVANIARKPVVMTCHGAFSDSVKKGYKWLNHPAVVSISKAQVKDVPRLNLIGNVYNGLSMEHYPFANEHDGYLLFVGRISPQKGVHYAVRVAHQLDLPLIIAAKLEEVGMPYFKKQIEPYLSDKIKWIGEVDETERNRLMSRAMCFLHPVTWEEPFGLTLIEGMACGCPVVAFGRGSIPEIVVESKTGFVVASFREMLEAVKRIDSIKRTDCRKHALTNFSAKAMADGYEEVYERVVGVKV